MVRKGFRQRLTRYLAFTLTFFSLYALWAYLFGEYDFVLAALKALPFALAGTIILDLLGLGLWIRKRKVTRAIPTLLLIAVIVFIVVRGELWAAIPLLVLLIWIMGYVLRELVSGQGGKPIAPPRG